MSSKKVVQPTVAKDNEVIVIAQGGFVFIGVKVHDGSDYLRLEDASCIRVWGTTAGIGEIALRGPTAQTILDPCGVAEFKNHAVIMVIPCVYNKAP